MGITVTWHGHAAFAVQASGKTLLIDPFFSGNPATKTLADDVHADVILVSHGHEDHVGDTVGIAQRTGALCIANSEVSCWLEKQGVQNTHPLHIGGQRRFDFGTVKLTIAHHGSMFPDGSNGGNPCGILLKLDGGTIYYAGDTGLFYDMKLIGEEGVDLAILPIGDNFTMGPEDSLRAIRLIEPGKVLPHHYNTWPVIEQDPQAWAHQVKAQTRAQPVVLAPGESMSL